MSEALGTKDQSDEIATKPAEDEDLTVISNNNYKTTRDDAEVADTETAQDVGDSETESEMKVSAVDRVKDQVETTAANLSMPRTGSSTSPDCPADFSRTAAPRNQRPQSRSLAFSIDRIMARRNDDVGGTSAAAKSDDVTTMEDSCRDDGLPQTAAPRGHSRRWAPPPAGLPAAASAAGAEVRRQTFEEELSSLGPASWASWLSRLQRETNELQRLASDCRRHQLTDWRCSLPLSHLVGRVSQPFYRQFQTSHVTSWLLDAAARRTVAGATSSLAGVNRQPATTLPAGQLAGLRPDSEQRRQAVHATLPGASRPAEASDGGGGRRGWTATDLFTKTSPRETPKFAASGALDLSRRSAHDERPQTSNVTAAFQSRQDAAKKQPDAGLQWTTTTTDLKNSLKNVVNQDLERPAKQIACPVCGKMFNAHYNLTRHMPVHTGARPFICKVCSLAIHLVQIIIIIIIIRFVKRQNVKRLPWR